MKSRAGRRAVGIPAPLVEALRRHKTAQEIKRRRAAQLWEEGDRVFAQPNGRPIVPRADHDAWKALLQEAGVRDARLHDARHTAATMLLVLGVPARAVMEVMGWSQVAMTTRYQHLAPELISGIARAGRRPALANPLRPGRSPVRAVAVPFLVNGWAR
ncbi:tyrosine-type recombinase/integrase [Actinoplanes sp. CA-054009]